VLILERFEQPKKAFVLFLSLRAVIEHECQFRTTAPGVAPIYGPDIDISDAEAFRISDILAEIAGY